MRLEEEVDERDVGRQGYKEKEKCMNHARSRAKLNLLLKQTKGRTRTRNHAKTTALTSRGWAGDDGSNLVGGDG